MIWLVVAMILNSSAWLTVCQADCFYKECICADKTIQCSDTNLKAIPPIANANLTGFAYLDLDGNDITSIPSKSLPPNLPAITFLNNPIANIDDAAFDDSSMTLTSLYFSNTALTRIPNAFGHLLALSYLSISGARIDDWNENVMKNISSLETLILENVGMETWPTWLQSFSKLRTLTISGNRFTSIPDHAFDNVANMLTDLTLENNKLTSVPKAISTLIFLQMLYLNGNQINDVTWLSNSSVTLQSLDLTNNTISNAQQLSDALRPAASSLTYIALTNNRLTAIPDLSYLIFIDNFDLTHNKISDPDSGAFPAHTYSLDLSYNSFQTVPQILGTLFSVGDMHLSYNYLTELHSSYFHYQTMSVDVSYNLITALTDKSFPNNSGILTLDLTGNPITQISTGAIQNLPNLVNFYLQATQLTRLPLGLSFLSKLTTLDVSKSPKLVCTCMESSLTKWIRNFNAQNVLGDCGQSSVYYFFSTLSSLCPTRQSLY